MGGTRQLIQAGNSADCSDYAEQFLKTRSLVEPWVHVHADGAASKPGQLARTIEAEIIPRLMLAHRPTAIESEPAQGVGSRRPGAEEVEEFARLILTHEVAVASSYVKALLAQGTSLEVLFLHLLSPAARFLGDLWLDDRCDFIQVTVGLSRLQLLLRELSSSFENEVARNEHTRRIMLAPMPGEQHTFGLFMVEEFFRRAGWGVWGGIPASADELLAIVRSERFDVVGFSVSCDRRLDPLASIIRAVRRASRNPEIGILVGGSVFIEQPELVALVGADATAVDGRQAALQAHSLLTLMPNRC